MEHSKEFGGKITAVFPEPGRRRLEVTEKGKTEIFYLKGKDAKDPKVERGRGISLTYNHEREVINYDLS